MGDACAPVGLVAQSSHTCRGAGCQGDSIVDDWDKTAAAARELLRCMAKTHRLPDDSDWAIEQPIIDWLTLVAEGK